MPEEYKHIEFPKWVHHPDGSHPSRLVHDETEELAIMAEWNVSPEEVAEVTDPLRPSLLERAARVGLDVNPRWSDRRLQEAVEKFEAKKE